MTSPARDSTLFPASQGLFDASCDTSIDTSVPPSGNLLHQLPPACRAALEEIFAAHPQITPVIGQTRILLPMTSPDGFAIALFRDSGRWTLSMGGWSDDFESVERAVEYIVDAVNSKLRIRIDFDYKPHTWAVERLEGEGAWVEYDRMRAARLFFKYKNTKSVYLRN